MSFYNLNKPKTSTKKLLAILPLLLAYGLCWGQQSGNQITQIRDGVSFVFKFHCDGGLCDYGQFATGDYWVVPKSPDGLVTITEMLPAGEIHAAVVNPDLLRDTSEELLPMDLQKQSILVNYPETYDAGLNIMNQLPFRAKTNQSIYKLKSQSSNCGTNAIANGCVSTATVLTILSKVPENLGNTVFRPPFHGSFKPLYTTTKVKMDRLPSLPQISNGLQGNIGGVNGFAHWGAPQVELYHKGFGEFHRATIPHTAQTPYAADQAKTLLEDITALFGKESIAEKTAAAYSIIQKGIDNYGVFKMGIPFSSGAGQHVGKKPPIVFFAALYDDIDLLNEVRDIATNPKYTGNAFFQEDSQIRMGPSGMAVWGDISKDLSDIHWYFSRMYPRLDTQGSAGDPYAFIDGPAGGIHPDASQNRDRNYMPVVAGTYIGYSLLQHLMPWFKYASGDPEILLFSDRLYSGYGIDNFDGGIWTKPDPVAPYDTSESGCNPFRLYSTGITGCDNYGKTWGANLNDFTKYIGHGGDPNTNGRMPEIHGQKLTLTRVPSIVSKHWNTLRPCTDPNHPSYPCEGLGMKVDIDTSLSVETPEEIIDRQQSGTIVFANGTIKFKSKMPYQNIAMKIYSLSGALITSKEGNGTQLELNLSTLVSKGIFIYTIVADNERYYDTFLMN